MYKSVLITREQESALHTANKLLAKGYGVVLNPLISIVYCDLEVVEKTQSDYMLITSFNAAKRVPDVYKDLSGIKLITVGEKSAEYLKSKGVDVIYTAADAEDLMNDIVNVVQDNASIDFVCGDHIASDLDVKLSNKGFQINKMIVYKSIAATTFKMSILKRIDTVLFYSPRTATIFAELVGEAKRYLQYIDCICISQNVAQKIQEIGFKSVRVADGPTEDELIKCV
jgi:uroporphyrinogen-III synthase